ncbi:hypothetical protein RchiOBHm_Chr6g0294731 [Rosa chinensis]|uniref:Uncharacterized protein n=1 Tax=Rosa chinensis TaxID=74649 RepID=A0A2P6PX01_ROSCH|nr:uncharacterized protein LOC112174843 [Rosa chinensis]PRQ26453.1 hypothetical protein RchiOBHm_Chr6g0294731 [Rosa chinensis]
MGQGASRPKWLTRSERQDELLKMCPLPATVIRRPNTNPDGSDIPSISGSDFEFPDPNCETWIRKLYQAMSSNQDQDRDMTRYYQHKLRDYCGIEVDLSASLPTKS